MKNDKDDATNADTIISAFQLVLATLGIPVQRNARTAKAIQAAEVQTALVDVDWSISSARFRAELRPAFGLGTEVAIQVGSLWGSDESSKHAPPRIEVRITWASGGGSVSESVAQASQHLEIAQRAARAEMILQQAFGRMGGMAYQRALAIVVGRSEDAWDAVRQAADPESEGGVVDR